MSRGHGKMERFVIGSLFHVDQMGVEALASIMAQSPFQPALLSSLRRALRRLKLTGKIDSVVVDGANRWFIDNDYKATAIHEAGHAVIGILLGEEIEYASVRKNDESAGRVMCRKNGKPIGFEKLVMSTMAGRIAVTRSNSQGHTLHDYHGAREDNRLIRQYIIQIIQRPRKGHDGLWHRPFEITEYRERASKKAEKLVTDNWHLILGIAGDLAERGTMTGNELAERIKFHAVLSNPRERATTLRRRLARHYQQRLPAYA